jgi:hypothetical protein
VTLSCTQGGSSQGGERRTCEARKRRKCADAKQATVQAREMQPAAKRTEKREPKGKPPCPTAREVEARDKNARGAKATETSLVVHNGGAAKSKETALVMHDGGPVKSTDTALVVHDGGAGKRRFGANVAALVHEHPLFTAGGSQLILVIMSRGQGPAGFGSSSRAAEAGTTPPRTLHPADRVRFPPYPLHPKAALEPKAAHDFPLCVCSTRRTGCKDQGARAAAWWWDGRQPRPTALASATAEASSGG